MDWVYRKCEALPLPSIDVVTILERAQATSRLKQLELSEEMTTFPAVVHLNRFLDKLKY